jgi:hypothetical protein
MSKSLIPAYDPKTSYGFFGYPGMFCHLAVKSDDAEMAEECWTRGWMDINCRMLVGTLAEECERRAPKVGERLRRLGPCRIEPRKSEEFIAEPAIA